MQKTLEWRARPAAPAGAGGRAGGREGERASDVVLLALAAAAWPGGRAGPGSLVGRTPTDIMTTLAGGDPRRMVAFASDGIRFGIPLEAADTVLRMVAISPLPGAPPVVLGVVSVHGEVVAVADVCRRLGLGPTAYGPESHLLLARTRRRRLALAAHEVQGVIEVSADAIATGASLAPVDIPLAGAVGLPDGIVFINDLEAFLSAADERQLDRALEARR